VLLVVFWGQSGSVFEFILEDHPPYIIFLVLLAVLSAIAVRWAGARIRSDCLYLARAHHHARPKHSRPVAAVGTVRFWAACFASAVAMLISATQSRSRSSVQLSAALLCLSRYWSAHASA